jgi:hypothetical protein
MSEKPLSYTECVHRVLQAAPAPMTMDELIQAVGQMRPLTAKNIRSSLGNALHQSPLTTSLGDGRYGWMPHLLKGNSFRLRPSANDLKQGRLPVTEEAKLSLWPSFFGPRSRRREPLVRVDLADGPVMERPVESLGTALWGIESCPELVQWYRAWRVRAGDDLILTVIDADASPRRYRLAHEPASQRDDSRVEARNRQLADAAYDLIRRGRAEPLYYLVPKLAARGFYNDPCPPASLEKVLQADGRFRDAGLLGFVRADDPDYVPGPLERMLGRPPKFEDLMDMFLDEVEPEEYVAPPTDQEIRDIVHRLLTMPLDEDEADEEIERLALAEEEAVTELMRFVAGRDRGKHRLACQILVRLESDLAVEPLRQSLRDPKVIDDYKVDIITALMHLDGLQPGENPFEYLRDAEGAMRRTQQEFLDMMRDPLELCNFVQENIKDLPFFQSPEQFQYFVTTGGSETFPLLLCLLHASENQVVVSTIEAMETLQLPEAVSYLEERAAYDPNRKVRRAAQRVAERLTDQVGRRDETPTPPDEPLLGCFVSSIDGSGGQILVIGRETADGHCKFLNVMFNDHEGIKDCFGGLSPTLEEVQEFIGGSFAEMGIELVNVSLERAREELVRAHQITREAHRRLPVGLMAWRHWALGEDPKPPKVFPLPEIRPDEREALLAECDKLLDLEEFESWFFNAEDLRGLDRQYRRLQNEDPTDEAQEEALITQGVRRVVDKARRQLLRDRLRRQAWLLAQIYEEDDVPGMALVAADALEDDSLLPPEEHLLLREMMLDSFFNAVEELFE